MAMPSVVWMGLVLLMMGGGGRGQSNNQPTQPGRYYMDSNADCNGPVREIYGQSVSVIGHGAIQEQQSPQSCTLKLRSTGNFDQTTLRIEVVAAIIRDCDVQLTLHDGDPGNGILRGYDCNSPNKQNEGDFITTGDVVSFTLTRRDSINSQFDIEIVVTPIVVSGQQPGYENDYGNDWGFFREKLENDAAIGIVGAVFTVTIILVLVGVFCCYRRFEGKNKPWEQHQLSTFRAPTGESIYETKSRLSDESTGVWASNVSRSHGAANPRHRAESRLARSEDGDSVFEAASDDTPPKRRLMEQDRQRERERERPRGRGRDFASQNNSYVQADDDHPQDMFVERVITPRRRRSHKPPPYDEAVESDTERSSLAADDDDDDDDMDHKEISEEETSEPQSSSEEEEEEEEEAGAAAPKPRPQPQHPAYPPGMAAPMRMPPPGAYPPGYGYPPMGGYPMPPPGQFVPVMAPRPPAHFSAGPGHPPPRYPMQHGVAPPPPPHSGIRPTDPPIYSYLVQRGYTPLDVAGRSSPASLANTSQSQASLDDSEKNILASGVEYMRR